jgi:uncharacterized protein YkwD
MSTAPTLFVAFLFVTSAAILQPATAQAPNAPVADTNSESDFEAQTEQQLLVLANQSRKQAGAPPLTLDIGLSQAARTHARAMLKAQELSHQFDGEPSLPERLAAATHLHLEQVGENVALDYDAVHAHEHLMHSPPHRANLLNPAYNVVGMGVVRSGDGLYIVQDFGHALPNYSAAEVKDRVAAAVNQSRQQAGQPELPRHDLPAVDDAACSMARADKLETASVQQLAPRAIVLTYTSLDPKTLPAGAGHALASRTLHSFSVGACYSRTETYPTGVYWIVLLLE